MCESSVWLRYPDGRTEKIADDVLIVAQEGDTVVLRWFLAEPRRVVGTIRELDAIKHIITLNVTEAPAKRVEEAETSASHPDPEVAHVHPHPHPH
jgi:predicted RNA-binding protein